MKNYQKALDRIRVLKTQMYADFIYRVATKGSMILLESEIDDNLNLLQELIDEQVESTIEKNNIIGSVYDYFDAEENELREAIITLRNHAESKKEGK